MAKQRGWAAKLAPDTCLAAATNNDVSSYCCATAHRQAGRSGEVENRIGYTLTAERLQIGYGPTLAGPWRCIGFDLTSSARSLTDKCGSDVNYR